MPSTNTDLHLSDVHLHCPGTSSAADEVSRFAFTTDGAESSASAAADDDGDQILKRRRGRTGAIKLRHALATPLPDVGLQVWRGALLLCDYLLAMPSLVRGATVLELGSGCGLCGLLRMVEMPPGGPPARSLLASGTSPPDCRGGGGGGALVPAQSPTPLPCTL